MTSVASPSSFHDAVTIRQKLNILEAWRKSQENELMLEKAKKNPSGKFSLQNCISYFDSNNFSSNTQMKVTGKQISNSNSSSRRNLSVCI